MNVGELKKRLAVLSDDTLVLVPGYDRSYNWAHASPTEVIYSTTTKSFSEPGYSTLDGEVELTVLVIS